MQTAHGARRGTPSSDQTVSYVAQHRWFNGNQCFEHVKAVDIKHPYYVLNNCLSNLSYKYKDLYKKNHKRSVLKAIKPEYVYN